MINLDSLHQAGYYGKDITIAVLDAGFPDVDTGSTPPWRLCACEQAPANVPGYIGHIPEESAPTAAPRSICQGYGRPPQDARSQETFFPGSLHLLPSVHQNITGTGNA